MALFESVNNYNIGKIGQAGISSKEQGYINEINNTTDALASMFTSPTAWTDLINVLSILDKKIDDNFNVNERQKLIAEKINKANKYKTEIVEKLETIRTQIERSGDNLLTPAKSAIIREIGDEMGLVVKSMSPENIGKKALGSKNTTLSALKKSYIEQIKKSFSDDTKKAQVLISQIENYKANDSDITEFGIAEINNMIAAELRTLKAKSYSTKGGLDKIKTFDAEQTAKRLVDEALEVYAPHVTDDSGYKRQGAVEAFYQSVDDKMKQILNGSYIKDRVKKTFGENNAAANKMANPLASGQNSLKSKLEQLSRILEKEQYEMYIAASKDSSKIRVGAYKSKDSGIIFNRNKETHKIESVNWDKMANFELGLDLNGLLDAYGMPKINQLVQRFDNNGSAYLTTLQEEAIDNILNSFKPTFSGKEGWGMRALKSGKLSDIDRVFKSKIKGVMSGAQSAGSFKRGQVTEDMRSALGGSGSQMQLAVKMGIVSLEKAIEDIIYGQKINNLFPNKSANSSKDSQLNALKTDLYQMALAYGLGGDELFDKLVLQNKDFDYITTAPKFTSVLKQIKEMTSLGVNMGSIKEGAAGDFLIGTVGQEVFSPFGELGRGSDRSYAQVKNILKKIRDPKNSKDDAIKKAMLKKTMLASSSGLRNNINYDEKENYLYNIGYITEKQVSDAYKKFKAQKLNKGMSESDFNKKYGAFAPSVTNDSGIYNKGDHNAIEYSLDSYRYITKRMSEEEYNKLFDEIYNDPESKNLTVQEIQEKIAQKMFDFNPEDDVFQRVIEDFNTNERIFGYNKAQYMTSGTKLLNMATGTRYTGQGINEEFFNFLKNETGYKNSGIHEFLSADTFKRKNIPGLLSSRLDYFLSEAVKSGKSPEEISKVLADQKSLLSEYMKYDSTSGKFVNQFDIAKKLREQAKDQQDYAKGLRGLFTSIEDLGVSLGLQDNDNRGLTFDEDGNMLFGKNFITSTAINQADIYHYDKSVGDLLDDELAISRHTFSDKERDAIKRQIGITRAKSGKDYSELQNYLENLTAIPDKISQEYQYEAEQNRKAIVATSYSDTPQAIEGGVSIGFGDGYDINLEKELNRMGYTEGGIAEGDFINSIYQKIAEHQEEYRNFNGLMDGEYVPTYVDLGTSFGTKTTFDGDTEYVFGGNKVYIPTNKIKSHEVNGKKIYDLPGTSKELNSLLSSVVEFGKSGYADEDLQSRVQENSLNFMKAVYNDAYNKKGHIWQLGNKTKLKNSGVSTSNSVNAYDVLNETDPIRKKILTSSLQLSEADVRSMISGDLSSSDYYNTLKLNYEDLFGKEFVNDIIGNDNKLDIVATNKLLQDKIIQSLIVGSDEFNERIKNGRTGGLRAMFHRYPSTNGLDERFTDIFIDKNIQQGFMKAGLGQLRASNGDSDGDHVYAALTTFGKGITKSVFNSLEDLQQADQRVAEAVAYTEAQETIKNNEVALKNSEFGSLYDKEADATSSILAKMNKGKVGVLSNISTALRTILKDVGLDEINAGSDIDSQRNAAKSLITRGIFEAMEQDAISSKKVEERILAKNKDANMSKEDIMSNALTEIDNLVSSFYDQNITERMTFIPELMEKLQAIGVLGEDDDIFSDRIGSQIMASIQQFSHGEDILAELFGVDVNDKNFQENLYKWDKDNHVKSGQGKFSIGVAKNAVSDLNIAAAKYGKNLMSQLTWGKNVAGKTNADNNPAYAFSKVEGVNQDYSNAIDVVAAAHNNATAAIEGHSKALKEEMALEKEKIKIANGEAVAVGKAANAHGQNTDKLNEEKDSYLGLHRVAGVGNSWTKGNVSNLPRQSVTSYISKVLPNEYVGSMDYNTFNNAIDNMTLSKEILAKLTGDNITDAQRMEELGINDPRIFNSGRQRYRSTKLGILSHSVSEAIARVKRLVGDEDWNNDISGISEWLKNNVDNSKYAKVREIIEKYQEEENSIVKGMQLLGYSQEAIDFTKYDAQFRGSKNVNTLNKIKGMNGKILEPEFKGYMSTANTLLNGVIDSMSFDGETLKVFDYKNANKVGAEYGVQLFLYEKMLRDMQKSLRDKAGSSFNWQNQGSYTPENIKNVFGQEIDPETLRAIMTFKNVEARLIQSDDYANTTVWKAIDKKNISEDIIQKLDRGELLTEEEKNKIMPQKDLGGERNTSEEYLSKREQDEKLNREKEFNSDLEKRISLEKELYEIIAKINAENSLATEKEIKDAQDRVKEIDEEIKTLDEKYAEGGERSEWGLEYGYGLERKGINRKEIEDKAKQENNEKLEKSIKAKSSEYLTKLKQTNKIEEQIKSIELAISETPQNDPKLVSLRESLVLLKQQLAYYDSIKVKLDEQNGALIVGEGENQRILKLNQEQLSNLQRQKALIDSQHISNLANITAPKQKTGFIEEMFGNFQRQIKYMTTQSVVYKVIGGVQQTLVTLINTIKELDKAMVNLQIASGYTREEMKSALTDYNSIAIEMGRSTQEVLSAANDWLRAGYDIKTANVLIKDSMKLSTLGMIDSAQATEYLISTMKGWKLQAEEVSGVVDDLTALDMEFATSAGDIAQAMAKANVSASLAGIDRKTYESMLTAVMDVGQQGADVVGTAFKTLFARYGNVKSGKYAKNYNLADSDTESSEETTKLNDVETVLNKVNIKTRDTVGQFRDMDDVLTEIASKWDSMDQVTQNAVTAALGGTRQREVLNTLFENWGSVEKAKKITEESDGTANKKMENYTQSIEAAQKGLTASIEKLTTSANYEKYVIMFYNLLSKLVDNLGTIIILLGGVTLARKGPSVINGIVGGVQKYGNFLSAPGRWINDYLSNRSERNREREIAIRERGITEKEFNKEWKANIKKEKGISNLDSSIISATARMEDNKVSVGEGKNKRILTTEDYNAARNFLTDKDNNFAELSKLSEKDWERVAQAIDNGEIGDWLDSNKKVNTMKKKGNFDLNDEPVFTSDREANDFIDYEARAEAIATSELSQAQEQETLKRKALAQKLGLADDATEEEIKARLKLVGALDENEDTVKTDSNTIRTRGKVATDRNVKNRLSEVPQGGKGDWIKTNGATIGAAGSMVGSVGAMIASRDLGQTAGTALTLGTSLAPMVGSIIGNIVAPGVGGAMGSAVGGAISGSVGIIAALISLGNKTSEEILQEAQKATEELDKIRDKISAAEETRSKLEDNEVRFAELVKGVNSSTGKNVSLSDSEWSEYQDILSSIIDSRDDLYASYDAEGNIVAKNAQGIADLNAVMADSIQLQKDKIQQENAELAKDTKNLAKETAGNIENAKYKEVIEFENGGVLLDLNYTTNEKKIKEYGNKYGVDIHSITSKSASPIDAQEAYLNLIQAGMTEEEFIETFDDNISSRANRAKEYYQQILKSEQFQGIQESNTSYSSDIKRVVGYALKGNDYFSNLSLDEQSFIQNQLFGGTGFSAFDSKGNLKDKKAIEEDMKAYQTAALKISELVKSGSINLDNIINYNKATDNAKKDQVYLETMKDIINQSGLNDERKAELLSNYGFVKDNEGNWITQRQSNTNELIGRNFNLNLLNQLSTEQLNALYNSDLSSEGYKVNSEETLKKLKQELSELILGENATLTEYFADFANQTGTSLSDIEGLKEALANPENQDLFSLKKLKESFKELGYDVEKTDVLAEVLTKHMSTLGSIDANGYTSKSLSEIESQFENIDSIVSDLVDNGKLSVENMQKLLEEFPEMIKYLGEGKDLLEAMEELQKDQAELQFASIKNTIAESEENYTEFLSTLKKEGKINDNLKDYLGMFGNSKNLVSLFNQMYQENENGNYTLKSRYKDMRLMDNSDFSQNSWEKIVGKYIFGIDTTTGTKEDISRKISDAVQAQADKLGLEGNTEYFINFYRHMMTNNSEFINAFQQVSDLENQLAAAKASQQLENSQWEEKVSKEISKLKDAFDAGKISIDDYIKGLQEIRRWSNLTEEQIRELDEAIEDAKFDKLSDQFDKGQISVKNYREELSKLMKNNALGSDDYNKFLETYLGTYDTEISKLENQKSLLADKDFQGQKNILNQENLIYEEKLAALIAAGQKNSEAYLEVLEKIKSNKEQQLEITKQELEYEKEKLETVMDAYSTLIDYRINQLQKEKDLLEERYDDEIDKLKEVNDQKQRSIDLEKYQQELENARKEKSRIYISGVGWTYQANQAKVDEAQTNLDNYLEDRKISDLENSKNREAKYYQDQIDFWNETKEKIEDVPKLASAEEAVKELIRNNVVAEGSTINTALTDIKKGITVDVNGHVKDLGGKFEIFKNNYNTVTGKLNDLNSAMDSKLGAISDYVKTYAPKQSDIDTLKQAFTAGISNLNINKPEQSTVDWNKRIGDIQTKLQNAQNYLSRISSTMANNVLASAYQGTTTSYGKWSKGKNVVENPNYKKMGVDGRYYYQFTNTESGNTYWVATQDTTWRRGDGILVDKGADYYSEAVILGTRSNGLEGGMISRTGLYKLHGTPNNPEFVLNSKQAYQLLRNISTLSIPAFESKTSTNKTINYQFYGDMNLPNVKDPSTFFSELLREADGKFNVTKLEY